MSANITSPVSSKAIRIIFFALFASFTASISEAQSLGASVMGSAGEGESSSSVSFSFGEFVSGTMAATGGSVEQGFEKMIGVDEMSSVNNEKTANVSVSVAAFPAPFVNTLNVRISAGEVAGTKGVITIVDVSGKKVMDEYRFVLGGESNTYAFSVNELTKGVYFVKVAFTNASVSEKIVKVMKVDGKYHPY